MLPWHLADSLLIAGSLGSLQASLFLVGSLAHCQLTRCLAHRCLSDSLLPPWHLLTRLFWLSGLLAASLAHCWLPSSFTGSGILPALILIAASLVHCWLRGCLTHCWLYGVLAGSLAPCWLHDSLPAHKVPGSLLALFAPCRPPGSSLTDGMPVSLLAL